MTATSHASSLSSSSTSMTTTTTSCAAPQPRRRCRRRRRLTDVVGVAITAVIALGGLAIGVDADCYMHHMRGSNNRLNENNSNRNTGNRLFDSQNNNRGGYNVGDRYDEPFADTTVGKSNPDGIGASSATPASATIESGRQYAMEYVEGSEVLLEWTNQHGCGGTDADDPHKLNCNIVIQYMCDTNDGVVTDRGMRVRLRDGSVTTRPQAPKTQNDNGKTEIDAAVAVNDSNDGNGDVRGRHESEAYYYECLTRNREFNLFTADQPMGNGRRRAKNTRQNNNGNQNGLECPEERDYWPYWHPTPWRDIAYLSDDQDRCATLAAESQNVVTKSKCVDASGNYQKNVYEHTQQAQCEQGDADATGTWRGFTHGLPAPACAQAEWTRDNHLGNARSGEAPSYNWTLPSFDDLVASGAQTYPSAAGGADSVLRCVLRVRYNITTDDYDPWRTDARYNHNPNGGVLSPVTDDPTIDVGVAFVDQKNGVDGDNDDLNGLRLAIDTNQYGRTFQDRSHVFLIRKRATAVTSLLGTKDGAVVGRVVNLQVRGKRGNIVQTYPSVEYDFVPNRLHMTADDVLHIQWTGSNTHRNNGNGDGQGGDAGEGRRATDRHNFVLLRHLDDNFPLPYDKTNGDSLFDHAVCHDPITGAVVATLDCQVRLATSGQFLTAAAVRAATPVAGLSDESTTVHQTLDTAPASFANGILLKFTATTGGNHTDVHMFHYMCTRNNNFSNRSQKGTLIVNL